MVFDFTGNVVEAVRARRQIILNLTTGFSHVLRQLHAFVIWGGCDVGGILILAAFGTTWFAEWRANILFRPNAQYSG